MRKFLGGKLGTVVADHSIRTSISGKVVLNLGYHSRGTCASQLVNFPRVAVVVNSNEKVFAFVREQVSGDPFPWSVWYCSTSQCFLWLPQSYCLHVSHDSTSCFISAHMPGQYMDSLARLRQASIPMCDECTFCFITSHSIFGTTTRSPLKIRPF